MNAADTLNLTVAYASVATTPPHAGDIAGYCWPLARLGEALEELAARAGLAPQAGNGLTPPAAVMGGDAHERERWMEWAGSRLGIEAEAVEVSLDEFAELAAGGGPAVFFLEGVDTTSVLLLMSGGRHSMRVIGPDHKTHRIETSLVRAALCVSHEAPLAYEIDRLLDAANLPAARRMRVRSALLLERLTGKRLGTCWLLRLPPSTGFWRQLVHARLPHRLAWMLGMFGIVYTLELASWGLIGEAAINGRFDMGWMSGWVLLVLTFVPLQLIGGWLDATFALHAGRILKQRLLAGALKMELQSVRLHGAGQLLSRVMESQALESLAVNGGLSVLVALLELGFAGWVLAMGIGGGLHVVMLACWLMVTLAFSARYIVRMRNWTLTRLDMTHELIEQMVGHRTRLAQEWPQRRDQAQDRTVRDYLRTSKQLDNSIAPVSAAIPGGWMLLGLAGLVPAFAGGHATSAGLAIGFGGILLANRAFTGIASGISSIAGALVAWQQVKHLFHSGAREPATGQFLTTAELTGRSRDVRLLDASSVVFRYQGQHEPVVRGVDLSIDYGERILLEGSSGGGKSTLAALISGLRKPDSGLLLLNGLDRHVLGDNWHRLITEAPQFHDNHILTGSLAFNLLMGRRWPGSEDDLAEAQKLCVELGLGPLLERMPSGLMQMVGETGWQLSHGERSRIFLARALLQDARLVIMDESFAALDPETLEKCLRCTLARARTLIVIAHP